MTTSQLTLTGSTVLDANGMGDIPFICPSGQYWLPMSGHVGTNMQNGGSVPQAGVHIGGPQVYNFATVVDFTFAANNDTTSLLSGQIVNPGQSLAAHFINGNPGDTALFTVVGLVSDIPPTIGIIPNTPGSHFSGAPGQYGAPVGGQTVPAFFENIALTINAGATVHLIPANPNIKLFLHTLLLDVNPSPNFTTPFRVTLQDTTGFAICTYQMTFIGTAANEVIPPRAPTDFKGVPMAKGVGIDLNNGSASAVSVFGTITYNTAGG
jgi:hypothetical protein